MSDFWGEDDEDEEELLTEEEGEEEPSDDSAEEEYEPPPMPPLRRPDEAIPPDSTPITPTDPQPADLVQVATQSPASGFAGIVGGLSMIGLSVAIDVLNLLAPAAGAIQSLPMDGAPTDLPNPP